MSAYVSPLPVRPAILMPEPKPTHPTYGRDVARHIMLATASTLALAMTMPAVRKEKPRTVFGHDVSALDWGR